MYFEKKIDAIDLSMLKRINQFFSFHAIFREQPSI